MISSLKKKKKILKSVRVPKRLQERLREPIGHLSGPVMVNNDQGNLIQTPISVPPQLHVGSQMYVQTSLVSGFTVYGIGVLTTDSLQAPVVLEGKGPCESRL